MMKTDVGHMSWSELEAAAKYKSNGGTTGNDKARVSLATEAQAELEKRSNAGKEPYAKPKSNHWLWK